MGFLDAFRRRVNDPLAVPGWAGGTLEDQLANDPQQPQQPQRFLQTPPQSMPAGESQQLTPTNQAAITRLRTVAQPSTSPFQQRFGSSGQPFAATRDRRTQPRDYVADDSQYLRDVQNKPDSLRDKAGLVAQSIATNLGGKPLPTRRQREERSASQQLGQDIAVQNEALKVSQGAMVPFQLPDGSVTMVPAKTAGTLASRQQYQQSTLGERKRMNDEHASRWHALNRNDRAKTIMDEYKSGGLNGNPELLDQASRELGLNGTLKDKFLAGQFQGDVDANGNIIEINKQTNEAKPVTTVTTASDGTTTQTPVTSFKKTQLTATDARARASRAAAMDRTIVMARAQGARMGDPKEFEALADQADQDAAEATAHAAQANDGTAGGKRLAGQYTAEAQRHKVRAAQIRESAIKARGAQEGAMSTKPGSIQPNEDPQIRDYANKHFNGDYKKALAAARKTGYNN